MRSLASIVHERTGRTLALLLAAAVLGCGPRQAGPPAAAGGEERPSLLLVTLDTTRADHVGHESGSGATPNLDRLAARGLRFSQAYSTVPSTLPAHASMLTGLYPYEHGLHENGRALGARAELLAERLSGKGYHTAAFVSGFPLAARFGLGRGFEHYDDDFGPGRVERLAGETTELAIAHLRRAGPGPLFLWVHYYDPHEPYEPPEPFRTRFAADPYLGEIAYMDHELGRLVRAFEAAAGERDPVRVLVAGDHGEGLGEHGEVLHGMLLYQGVMRVPLLAAGDGIEAGEVAGPVSIRLIFDTLLHWAGEARPAHLLAPPAEPVLGEAMKPFLHHGWQPQAMAVEGETKVIRAGRLEVYDLAADPEESRDLGPEAEISRELRRAIRDYPLPSPAALGAETLDPETREKLASLGYTAAPAAPKLRPEAPRPADRTHLFADLDRGSALFTRGRWAEAARVFERLLAADPESFLLNLRLAAAHSALGEDRRALHYFEAARRLEAASADLAHYLGMHHARQGRWAEAEPHLAAALAADPERLPALEAMARLRERQGRGPEALALLERAAALDPGRPELSLGLGRLRMAAGDTAGAAAAFERARERMAGAFPAHLELGVLYLAAGRAEEAREALDRVGPEHPAYPMALFKRAQVSVLLDEADRLRRVRAAWRRADETTRPLIENEALFHDLDFRD